MNAAEYQKRTAEFAVYPKDRSLEYLTLGLVGEAGEVANKVKKILRGDVIDPADVAAELGDVAWFLSEFCSLRGYHLEDLLQNVDRLPIPDGADLLVFETLRLCEEAGDLCNTTMNFGGGYGGEQWGYALDDVLGALVACADAIGFTPEQVFAANIAKLESRRARGVIQGNGDKR